MDLTKMCLVPPLSDVDINIALAVLLKGLPLQAETLKRRRAERGEDFYERQRSRGAGDADEQWNLVLYSILYNVSYNTVMYAVI